MKRYLVLGWILVLWMLFWGVFLLARENTFYFIGKIIPPTNWTGSHVEKVWFLTGGSLSSPSHQDIIATFDSQMRFSGSFWIGSVGWATFKNAQAHCPWNIYTSGVESPCYVSGNAWSKSAGWIVLGSGAIGGSFSGVYFNPNQWGLEGFWWSTSLGWVPIFTNVVYDDHDSDPSLPVGSGSSEQNIGGWGTNVNFIGRVAIIGNVSGSKVFSFINSDWVAVQTPWDSYVQIQQSAILNPIRSNIKRLMRNISKSQVNKIENNGFGFYYTDDTDLCFTTNTSTGCEFLWGEGSIFPDQIDRPENTVRSFVVVGKDIIIDANFNDSQSESSNIENTTMRALIALKDDQGRWGNIIITDAAQQIYAYLIAEGSVYSGKKDSKWITSYVTSEEDVLKGPVDQLYINGLIVSKNTIGGASQAVMQGVLQCPILTPACTEKNVQTYDIGYFRNYDMTAPWRNSAIPRYRDNIADMIKKASVIIDYNPDILKNPPPGLEYIAY